MNRLSLLLVFGLLLSGCGSAPVSRQATPPPAAAPTATAPRALAAAPTRYERAVLHDRPEGLWPLDDVGGRHPGDTIRALAGRRARVLDGPIAVGAGPTTERGRPRAARFTGEGRLVTDLLGPEPGKPFTVELFFRARACPTHWTQALGNASYDARGRQGLNLLQYPLSWRRRCQLGTEFWKDDQARTGCSAGTLSRKNQWIHFAVTFDGSVVRCYTNGVLLERLRLRGFRTTPGTPFGIGGAGNGYAGTLDSASLADVAVYSRALGPSALRRHVRKVALRR